MSATIFGLALCCGAGFSQLTPPRQTGAIQANSQPQSVSMLSVRPLLDVENPFVLEQNSALASLDRTLVAADPLKTSDHAIFQQLMSRAIDQKWSDRPLGETIQTLAEQFLGAPYAENLLDQSAEETLFVSLKQFDCVLFVETVLAMARGISVQDYSAAGFVDRVKEQRYENGEISGYCSRLHYFSHWIDDNQRRGIVTDLTTALGGIPLDKKLNFMSANWQKYPKLVKSEKEHHCIEQMEARLEGAKVSYIPTEKIRADYAKLQPGDIIAIATKVPGLDVTHTGFLYRDANGGTGIIHAAPNGVKISPDLERYVSRVDQAIGILVARPRVGG